MADDDMHDDLKPQNPVNVNVSDLFYCRNLERATLYDGTGEFVGYDPRRMAEEASIFLGDLISLGVTAVPTADDLLMDFYTRK